MHVLKLACHVRQARQRSVWQWWHGAIPEARMPSRCVIPRPSETLLTSSLAAVRSRLRFTARCSVLWRKTGERLPRRDDRMWRVPLAVPHPRLYTTTEFFPEGEVPPLYLKTGPGEFVKVELRKAAAEKSGS